MKRGWISLACVVLSGAWALAGEGLPELRLLKRIPFSEVVNDQGKPLLAKQIKHTDAPEGYGGDQTEQYGFIRGGKAFTPGWGGWVYTLETGEWKQEFPSSLHYVRLSMDGSRLCGYYEPEGEEKGSYRNTRYAENTETGKLEKGGIYDLIGSGWMEPLHPDNRTQGGPAWGKNHRHGIVAVDIGSAGVQMKGETLDSIEGFTANGRYLVVIDGYSRTRLIDTQTMKLLPRETIPIAEPRLELIFNRDASLVAGKKGANDWSTFVWDRAQKRFLWEDAMTSEPSAWSPNDKYLYCCDTIVEAVSGKTVFEKLKGHRGKFSPDGRSLVTVDEEAFYVYTLPKGSEPIFGVSQKPEPWSPGKAPARKPKGKVKAK